MLACIVKFLYIKVDSFRTVPIKRDFPIASRGIPAFILNTSIKLKGV